MSSSKKSFHIGKNGPATCNANKRACRYGEANHYNTDKEAEVAYSKQQDNPLVGVKSTKSSSEDPAKTLKSRKKFWEKNGYCPCNEKLRKSDGTWDKTDPSAWCDDIYEDHTLVSEFIVNSFK